MKLIKIGIIMCSYISTTTFTLADAMRCGTKLVIDGDTKPASSILFVTGGTQWHI